MSTDLNRLMEKLALKIHEVDRGRQLKKEQMFAALPAKVRPPGIDASKMPTPHHDTMHNCLAYMYDAIRDTLNPDPIIPVTTPPPPPAPKPKRVRKAAPKKKARK